MSKTIEGQQKKGSSREISMETACEISDPWRESMIRNNKYLQF